MVGVFYGCDVVVAKCDFKVVVLVEDGVYGSVAVALGLVVGLSVADANESFVLRLVS